MCGILCHGSLFYLINYVHYSVKYLVSWCWSIVYRRHCVFLALEFQKHDRATWDGTRKLRQKSKTTQPQKYIHIQGCIILELRQCFNFVGFLFHCKPSFVLLYFSDWVTDTHFDTLPVWLHFCMEENIPTNGAIFMRNLSEKTSTKIVSETQGLEKLSEYAPLQHCISAS